MEGRDLDAIVVELSGVADPAAVKQNWAQAVNVSTSVAQLCIVFLHNERTKLKHNFGILW